MDDHGLGEIRWPALSFGAPNSSMMRYNSAATLTTLSPSSLRSLAALTEHFVIDSTGTRFNLSEPEFIEPLSGIQKLISSLFGSKHGVRWRCLRSGSVDVTEVKRLVEDDWKTNESVWQALDLDHLRARLAAADSFEEVIAVFD
jgi:hypothetical protein